MMASKTFQAIRLALLAATFVALAAAGHRHIELERSADARRNGSGIVPIVSSISNQDINGGPVIFLGSNFGDGVHANSVVVWCAVKSDGGRPQPPMFPTREYMTVQSITLTQLTAFAFAGYDAGTYDCFVENNTGDATVARQQFSISATSLPSSSAICGASGIRAWYTAASTLCGGVACTNGQSIDTFVDLSGSGYNIAPTGTARPTYLSQSAGTCNGVPCFGSQPVISCNGTSNNAVTNSVSLGSTTNLAAWLVAREITHVASAIYAGVETPSGTFYQFQDTSSTQAGCGGISPGVFNIANYPFQISLYNDTGTTLKGCNVNNSTPITTAVNGTVGSGSTQVSLCASNGQPANGEIAEFYLCNIAYDQTKWAASAKYLSLKYSLQPPKPVAATNVADVGGVQRLNGVGFVPGMTMSISGIMGTTTTVVNSGTSAQYVVPAGTYADGNYNGLLTNPDGTTASMNGTVPVRPVTTDPNTICGQTGIAYLEGWWDADDLNWQTCVTAGCPSGTKISTVVDKSFYGADMIQATSGNQPVLTIADSSYTYLGTPHNSWTFDGTAAFFQAGLHNSTNPYGFWALSAQKENGASSGIVYGISGGAIESDMKFNAGSGKVSCFNQSGAAATATYATNLNGVVAATSCSIPAGANPTIVVNVGNSGSPVSQTSTCSALTSTSSTQDLGAFRGGGTYYKGTQNTVVKLNADPGSTIKSQLETFMQTRNCP